MDDEKISKTLAAARLGVAKREDPRGEEAKVLTELIALYGAETAAKRAVKAAQAKLDEATLQQYRKLSNADFQSLVIENKWGGRMVAGTMSELAALIQNLVERLNVLGERYAKTVENLDAEVEKLSAKVAEHLAAMGVEA